MMEEIRIPLQKLQDLIGHDAEIADLWPTADPIRPELVIIVRSHTHTSRHHLIGAAYRRRLDQLEPETAGRMMTEH